MSDHFGCVHKIRTAPPYFWGVHVDRANILGRRKTKPCGAWAVLLVLVMGCGRVPETSTEQIQVTPEMPTAGLTENPARWAKGFGWSDARRILWLASAGDTSLFTRDVQLASSSGGRIQVLPRPEELALGTWSTTHVPYLTAIGAQDQWVASGYADRIPDVQGALVDLGGDAGLDEERLVASGANVLSSYPFGNPMEGVSQRTGIPVLPLTEYAEPHPLGRAEYVRLFGWLTGRQAQADQVFDGIESTYVMLVDRAQRLALEHGRPTVFAGSSQSGKWTAPGADGLVAQLIEDAGGQYAFSSTAVAAMSLQGVGTNYEVELEQCAAIAAGSEFWGKVVFAPEGWTRAQAMEEAPWCDLASKTLFHCNTAEVDYFGQAVMEPHFMLGDLVALFQGGEEGSAPRYFKPTPP